MLHNKIHLKLKKPILSSKNTINHPNLSSFELLETSRLHNIGDELPREIEVPVATLQGLPGFKTNILDKNIFILLDSGCKYNLINNSIFKNLEKSGINLTRYKHNVSLSAHNSTNINLQPFGVIIPIKLKDLQCKERIVRLPFLIEKSLDSLPIIGFQSIKGLKLNFKEDFTICSINNNEDLSNLEPYDEICNTVIYKDKSLKIGNSSLSIADGTYLLEPCTAWKHEKYCKINHTPDVSCKLAKKLVINDELKQNVMNLLEYDPIVEKDSFQDETLVNVIDGQTTFTPKTRDTEPKGILTLVSRADKVKEITEESGLSLFSNQKPLFRDLGEKAHFIINSINDIFYAHPEGQDETKMADGKVNQNLIKESNVSWIFLCMPESNERLLFCFVYVVGR